MNLYETRLLAARCWASAGKRHDHNCDEHDCSPSVRPPLKSAEVSTLCDELILVDDGSVRVMTLLTMFLHRHPTAYPGIVARSLVDHRRGARLYWKYGRFLGWEGISRAADTYLGTVIFDEPGLDYGDTLLEVLARYSNLEVGGKLSDKEYIRRNGREGWTKNPDGSDVYRKLNRAELTQKRTDETTAVQLHGSHELAALARSSQEVADQLACKQTMVARFVDQMVRDLFDDEIAFPDFHSISQRLLRLGGFHPLLGVDRLLIGSVHHYIENYGFPQGLTEYHLNDGLMLGSVNLTAQGRPQYHHRQQLPSWMRPELPFAQ